MTMNNKRKKREYVSPRPADVLCGKGRVCTDHPGNREFRRLIETHLTDYVTGSRAEKTLIVQMILRSVQRRGGRFLKKDLSSDKETVWYLTDTRTAREKVGHALRDLPSILTHSRDRISKDDCSVEEIDEDETVLAAFLRSKDEAQRESERRCIGTHETEPMRKLKDPEASLNAEPKLSNWQGFSREGIERKFPKLSRTTSVEQESRPYNTLPMGYIDDPLNKTREGLLQETQAAFANPLLPTERFDRKISSISLGNHLVMEKTPVSSAAFYGQLPTGTLPQSPSPFVLTPTAPSQTVLLTQPTSIPVVATARANDSLVNHGNSTLNHSWVLHARASQPYVPTVSLGDLIYGVPPQQQSTVPVPAAAADVRPTGSWNSRRDVPFCTPTQILSQKKEKTISFFDPEGFSRSRKTAAQDKPADFNVPCRKNFFCEDVAEAGILTAQIWGDESVI